MSTLSKVFVILIVISSFVYLGVTSALFAHRVDWKLKHGEEVKAHGESKNDLGKKISEALSNIEQKDQKIGTVEGEVRSRGQVIEKLETDMKTANSRNEKLTTELAGIRTDVNLLKSNLDEAQKRNEVLQDKVAELQKDKDQAIADRDAKQNALKENQHNLTVSERNLADLEKQYIGRMKELDEAKTTLAALTAAGVRVQEIGYGAQKPVDARVLAVSETMNLLIISAGRDAGVEPGMEFTIYRGDKFVGKAVVEKADKDWSSCRSVKEFETDRPQVGDNASNKVY